MWCDGERWIGIGTILSYEFNFIYTKTLGKSWWFDIIIKTYFPEMKLQRNPSATSKVKLLAESLVWYPKVRSLFRTDWTEIDWTDWTWTWIVTITHMWMMPGWWVSWWWGHVESQGRTSPLLTTMASHTRDTSWCWSRVHERHSTTNRSWQFSPTSTLSRPGDHNSYFNSMNLTSQS